jgi:hypothetical protein
VRWTFGRQLLLVLAVVLGACTRGPAASESEAKATDSASSDGASSATLPARATSETPSERASLSERCGTVAGASLFTFPRRPLPGKPFTALVVADEPIEGALEVAAGERVLARSEERRGAGPFHWYLTLPRPTAGPHALRFQTPRGALCASSEVGAPAVTRPIDSWSAVWPIERAWERGLENLYSVWVERLFDAPLTEQPVWSALSEVLRDPSRNLLHDYLGEDEDHPERGPRIEPDCADLPYTLRAYFAFKLGLPFGYSRCTRGGSSTPPTCQRWSSSLSGNDGSHSAARRLGNFLRVRLANAVHSGTVRVKGDDDSGDFYPVRLDARTLAPGTVYADPYGHILVVVKRVPQRDGSGGIMLAVDGQPDNTISRRRFWRGNFLFASDPVFGGPGFKRFRPVVVEGAKARPLTNAEIAAHPDWGDYGLEQYALDEEGFFDAVDGVLSPEPRDPELAFRATIDALDEQVRRRLVSIDNGVAFKKTHPGAIEMPPGAEIFETSGAWEDYSTPARDMRLLIGIDVVRRMPERVVAQRDRWANSGLGPSALRERLESMLTSEAARRRFTYIRSDGSSWELSLADVIARTAALEMAYNPNDCPETRWGAPEGSEERSTCRSHAPASQHARMETHRSWFRERRRPPRL